MFTHDENMAPLCLSVTRSSRYGLRYALGQWSEANIDYVKETLKKKEAGE